MIAAREHGIRPGEAGVSISMVVLALTIVAMIMLYIGAQTLNSIVTSRTKQERSVGMAAGDSGIEKVRAALQAGLADDTDGFQLTEADLRLLVDKQEGATVVRNSEASERFGMSQVLVPASSRFTVREEASDSVGYWQVYNVIEPRYLETATFPANDVVYYIRAWATAKDSSSITTKPRVFRVEFRPTYFSDYQSVTDAPFFVKDNNAYQIDGPVHSNGYETVRFLAIDSSGNARRGIYFQNAPTCTTRAAFSTSQDAPIAVPGGSCATAASNGKTRARQLSLLGVQDTYRKINNRCSTAVVACFNTGGPYDVRLGAGAVSVNGTNVPLVMSSNGASASAAILLDGDVRLRGALTMSPAVAGRVTIATRRRGTGDRQPRFELVSPGGIVGAATPAKDTVGVVTEGDVILPPAPGCVTAVNLAVISQSGAVTIPPEFVTLAPPAVNLNGRECSNTVPFFGSFSAHGQFLASISWPDVRNGGRTPSVGYRWPALRYNRNLFRNPPPFFPTAMPWAVSKAKDADQRCLTSATAGDPRCE